MFSFGLSFGISLFSVAELGHVFVCWEIYFKIRIRIGVLILKYRTQQTNTYSITETLKQDVKSIKS